MTNDTRTNPEKHSGKDSVEVPHILVVDDEANFARRLAMAFTDAGFHAEACYDGAAAMKAMEKTLPDLIVLDVRMPGMDGLQCLRTMHADRENKTPPVILLTGDVSPRVDAAALIYPGSCVLSKPCSYDSVVSLAARLLRH